MRILIDLQGAQNGSRHRGIGRFSLAFAKAVAKHAGEHKVFILLNGLFPETIESIRSSFSGSLDSERFLIFECPGPVAELPPENTWRRKSAEALREYVISTLRPDAVLITSLVEGAEDDTVTSLGSLSSAVPTAVVLHDLIPLTDPQRYIGWEPAKRWYYSKIDSMRRADSIFAVSQSAANEGINLLPFDSRRIKIISEAADSSFSEVNVSPFKAASVAKRYRISRRYLMHSSAFEDRKNFKGLIRAYAALPKEVRADYQLVLVCKLNTNDREQLSALAKAVGLAQDDIVLTGFVPDEDLIALYVACHLFVFPSFHEGFGLPALEAMSCGAATIGANTTSVPEVIGRADALFDPSSIDAMTALIHKALIDGKFYESLKAHAKLQAAKFSWDETARRALIGLEEMVAQCQPEGEAATSVSSIRRDMLEAVATFALDNPPSELDLLEFARSIEANDNAVNRIKASAAFCGSLTWRLEGPFDSIYSLALLNRETARALTALGHTVILHSTEGPGDFAANTDFLKTNPDIDAMHRRVHDREHETVDAISRNLYPPRVHDMEGRPRLLHSYAWEESGFPTAWAANFNDHLEGVTCLSTHVENVLLDNGVRAPMTTSGCGVDHWERVVATPGYPIDGRSFRFLHVSSCFPRKGVDVLLNAYSSAFTSAHDVSLIIKTFPNPHNEIHSMLAELRARVANFPHVIVLEEELSDPDLKALYQGCHALVAPSRAEGFGLPMAEAILSGLPVITTAWSGQLDFCTEETSWLVDYRFQRAETHFGLPDSVWAEPSAGSLAEAMLAVQKTPIAQRRVKSDAGRGLLLKYFKWTDVAARLVVFAKFTLPAMPQDSLPRIGWVTTWNTKCGIATYSEHLIAQFPVPVTVLAPHQQEKIRDDGADCVRSWISSKEENGFGELESQIGRLRIDTLIIQFNYAFYNFHQFTDFVRTQIATGRRIIVMMHSTGDPGLLPAWNWTVAEVIPALTICNRVLVHSIGDLNRLKDLGLTSNVSLFPHGVLDVATSAPKSDQESLPLVCTYGFCLPHKGLVELVRAIAILREKGTPARLRLVNAEHPAAISADLVAQIGSLVAELQLSDIVETHHGYLTDDESLMLLKDADLIVYPYQQTQESASGAVRYGLATGRPVAVTPITVFADLGEAVYRLPGTSPQDLARGIAYSLSEIRSESESADHMAAEAERWRASHTYSVLGMRLYCISRALSLDLPSHRRVFDGSSRQFRTRVGQIDGRSLVSTGTEGNLLFGPYLTLAAGFYRIMIFGAYDVPPESCAHVDVCTDAGTTVLARRDFFGRASWRIVDVNVFLKLCCRDLEVRLVVDKLAEFRIDRVEILPRTDVAAIATGGAPETIGELGESRGSPLSWRSGGEDPTRISARISHE